MSSMRALNALTGLKQDFLNYLISRFFSLLAAQMILVVLSQYFYEQTHAPKYLALIGLFVFIPKMLFSLLAGYVADRYPRYQVVLFCRVMECLFALLMLFFLIYKISFWGILILLFLMGCAYAFDGPANQALLTQIVEEKKFQKAVSLNSSSMQFAFIFGPLLSGLLYAYFLSPIPLFFVIVLIRLLSVLFFVVLKSRPQVLEKKAFHWGVLKEGIVYVWQKKIILACLSLDLFAVLFGGAVALMPFFANDILKTGPAGLGMLRAAPAVGAALMAVFISTLPPFQFPGRKMLWAVFVFAICTLLFALSRNFYFSLLVLFILGAADMVSVVIRGVLVQMQTPPEMRGRVSAVNMIFIGASNELGEFESGMLAAYIGVVPTVFVGGCITLFVVVLWSVIFAELRKNKPLS